ncbi:MAG TPA: protein kinase [Pyrinomonadaceae bacterium]
MATGDQWQQVQDLFHAALERAPRDRSFFLDEACGGNEALRREVAQLLSAHETEGHFIDAPAYVAAADVLADGREFKPGEILDHYEVRCVLGEGGMGKVYLAKDSKLKRRVALKVLPAASSGDEEARRRLLHEAQAAAALDHPNICAIYEVNEESDPCYIAMQYVEGETLEARVASGRLPLDESLSVALQVADALSEAHARGIIHRDIKPSNIMLDGRGQVKVLDFGLAKAASTTLVGSDATETKSILTSPGMVLGTVPYMSPEQLRAQPIDVRTDIFSFGVVLYELLSGERAFARASDAEISAAILHEQPPELSSIDPGIPEALEQIVSKCLAKDAEQRYQTMRQVAHDLNAARNGELAATGIFATPTGKAEIDGASRRGAATTEAGTARPTSSIEYLVSKVRHHRRSVMLATAGVVILAAVLSYYFYFAKGGEAIDSIAVLPFVNVSNDPNADYLSDGISDSIINRLSQLPNLKKVISLSSVLRYKGKEIDPQAVGRELNVRAVLTGRLTLRGDELLISTELIDVKDNRRLWGEQYKRKLADVLPLQGEIAQEISERLRLKLTGEEKQRLAKRDTDNPEAYKLYLLGRFYRRNRLDFPKARDYLEQAIQKDPNFAPAYAQLAYVYHNLAFRPSEHEEARQKALWAARRALELDNTIGDAHTVLGLLNKDLRELERALELDPNSPDAQQFYAKMLWGKRLDEAIVHMRRAQELDPLSPVMYVDLGKMLNSARRFDEAMQQYRKALELNPNFGPARRNLALCYAAQGRYEEAIAEVERIRSSENGSDNLELRGYIYGRWGKRAEALKILDELSKRSDVNPYTFALIYTGLGDKDKAFEFLRKEHPAPLIPPLRVDPMWDSLRSDPRFEELLRQRESRREQESDK